MVEVVRFCYNKRFESQPNLANYLVRNVMQDVSAQDKDKEYFGY